MSRVSIVGLVVLGVACGLTYLPVAAFVMHLIGGLAQAVGP
jgi:hypothetical protein